MSYGRDAPYALQVEQLVIGGLLIDNWAWVLIEDKVVEADFYRKEHRLLFRVISHLASKDQPYDVVTVAEYLKSVNKLAAAGGLEYLISLADDTPSTANIVTYADVVRDKSVLRQLMTVGTDINTQALNPDGRTVDDLLENAEKSIFAIAEQHIGKKVLGQHIKNVLVKTIDRIEEMVASGSTGITWLATKFHDLDELTRGLQKSNLIVVAGRPSSGKTAFFMNIAENIAIETKLPIAVFSMEMPAEDLSFRLLSSIGRIKLQNVMSGRLDDDEWVRMTDAITVLAETNLLIDDSPALSVAEVRARARRLAREHGALGLIGVDYMQLMSSPSQRDNENDKISDISKGLKALAKELNVPVVALSQLNRNLESRVNKRPIMSDLRASGSIEQDADLILFIYRDEVYNPDSADKGIAEIIIGKQRNGPLDTVRLNFFGQYARFANLKTQGVTS